MAVDGLEPDRMRDILDVEISAYERRERQAVKVWEAAGGYAPTIGILGAVLGLIHVMENLTDPSKLGSGIAVAFVATLYGVGLANLVLLPIANRLKAIVSAEVTRRELMADVFVSIANGDNARVIEERMLAYG
jgi:chemotaxis protein MotA